VFSKPEVDEIINILSAEREEILAKWQQSIQESCSRLRLWFPEGTASMPVSQEELGEFFDAYLDDLHRGGSERSERFVVKMVAIKIQGGCSLAFLELINSTFADVVRRIVQVRFPDSFDSRARYMQWIAELVSRNDLRLAHEYETLLEKLNKQVLARQTELEQQNALMQEFFDAAAHEFQAPLWSILGFATKMLDNWGTKLDSRAVHALVRIQDNVRDMHLLIRGFARILRVTSLGGQRVRLPLTRVIRSAVTRVQREFGQDCRIEVGDSFPDIHGDFRQIETMFYELLRNGLFYVPKERTPTVQVVRAASHDARICVVRVIDNGIGIPSDYSSLVWKPLERLNDIRVEGPGLGLTYVKRVVEVHGGDVSLVPNGRPGTCVEIRFPIMEPEKERQRGASDNQLEEQTVQEEL